MRLDLADLDLGAAAFLADDVGADDAANHGDGDDGPEDPLGPGGHGGPPGCPKELNTLGRALLFSQLSGNR